MKSIYNFLSDNTLQISAVNAGIWLSALDWSVKIIFGLPSTIYVCLKIYNEFLQRKNSAKPVDQNQ